MSAALQHQEIPPQAVLHQMMCGHWVSQAIYVTAKLGIADHLADGPRHIDDLAQTVGGNSGALYRLLRALASVGLFTEGEQRHFALTPIGACLQTEIPGSMRPLAILITDFDWEPWKQMLYSVQTGKTAFERVHGMGVFDYFQQHPEQGQAFDEAMTTFVTANGLAVVAAYDFSPFAKIVDVGGGHGALMAAILKANVGTKGVIFDLPSVVAGAKRTIEAAGLSDRCELVGGDFFTTPLPTGGDAYMMASIIHDWDDERSLAILKNCRRAMSDHAKLLLVEMVIPPGDTPFLGKLLDLEMLVCFGGQDRTEVEYHQLLAAAGFQLARIVPTATPSSIIEAVPA
ncbi:MAG TPA: methyltransferase [Pyrinomonadaceae bacterium]|nr:methyltransferase [Pyrinomonadaceae bacterium]